MNKPASLSVAALAGAALCASPLPLRAAILQVPEGGAAVPVGGGTVCGALPGGWTVEANGRSVRPPLPGAEGSATMVQARIADEGGDCAKAARSVQLVATGPFPEIDSASVTFFPDEGRVELRGQRLKGVQVSWPLPPARDAAGAEAPREGRDSCLDPQAAGRQQACVVAVAPGLPAGAPFHWLPANARSGPDVVTYDAVGNPVDLSLLVLRPARVVLTRSIFASTGVDISQGPGRVALTRPEVATQVDCGAARCELAEGGVLVRSVPAPATQVTVALRLSPRVVSARGEALESTVTATLPLLTCPLSVISGAPLRETASPGLVVRLEGSCAREPRALHFSVGGAPAAIERVLPAGEATLVLLRTERILADRVLVSASRGELDPTTIAAASVETAPAPRPRVSLELPGHGKIDFLPTNRPATLTVASPGEGARLALLASEGAYSVVGAQDGAVLVRGDENAGGFVTLRFGYRVTSLPPELALVDLAVISERVERAVREASVPAPIGSSAWGGTPLIELVCLDPDGKEARVPPGTPWRIPYKYRDSCRVIVHREQLKAEDGAQEVVLEIEVTRQDGTPRAEARVHEAMMLHPGAEPRVVAVRSGLGQFDKLVVRVAHVVDEQRYVVSAAMTQALPSAQWSAVVEGGLFRLYATAAVPAGLYRVNQPQGQLTLNFGVLSRLTMLDGEGKESLLGLELGVMGVGLIPAASSVSFPQTLAIVAGIGLRVPLGSGAAISVNGWFAREFRDDVYRADGSAYGRWSFMFGPSIAVGNVGMNL